MPRPDRTIDFGLPPVQPWIRNLLVGAFLVWVLEMVLSTWVSVPLFAVLTWFPPGLEAPWTPLTRYFVQGPQVVSVLFGLFALYFSLGVVDRHLHKRQIGAAALAAILGGTTLALLLGGTGITYGPAWGWSSLASCSFALMGLVAPDVEIRLFFVLPVKGRHLVYYEGAIELLFILATRNTSATEHFGAWCGVLAWWYLLGPGRKRRQLLKKGKKVEKASHLRVVQGGQDENWH